MSQLLSAVELVPSKPDIGRTASLSPSPHHASRQIPSPTAASTPAPPSSGTSPSREAEDGTLKQGRIIIAILSLTGVNLLQSLCNGFITVGLPRIAADLALPQHLLVWPSAVYYLTCGSCLLLAGSIANVVGNRRIFLTGCFLTGWFITACGLSRTGIELIMFRAMQGVAVSLCLPTSVGIVANAIPPGRKRNIGFSCLGFVQPIGFSLGLVFEGVILDTVGWRFSFYLVGGLSLAFFAVSVWALPRDATMDSFALSSLNQIDWLGALMAASCLALMSYVLGTLTSRVTNIRQPVNILLLTLSILLMPAFILWQRRRERLHLPALIPNSLWENSIFTSICVTIVLSNAVTNAMEVFCSLFFQEIQQTTALGASLRILPSLITGFLIQLTTGLVVHRVSPYIFVTATLLLSTGAPLLMALTSTTWPYWYAAFPAQLVSPLACDVLFTVGLLVVSEVFPADTQALAGAVFNTMAQFGSSVGLSLMAIIAAAITQSEGKEKGTEERLLVGYRAAFWLAFAWMGLACLIGAFGLRRMGRVGLKRD